MPDFYAPESDYHWEPPAGDPNTYTFDLERAKQELDAAGYTDNDGNGVREYKGKDDRAAAVRADRVAREPELRQAHHRLVRGHRSEDQVRGDRRRTPSATCSTTTTGDNYAPDFDMFIWGWGGDVDPNFILSVMTTSSIEAWSDCIWSNEEYDELFLEQQTQIDLQERIATVQQMQQIVYDESPYIPLVYPLELEAVRHRGLDRLGPLDARARGLVWYNTQMDTYLAVDPVGAETEEEGGNTGLIVGIVIACGRRGHRRAVLLRRGRGRAETEA